MERGTGYYPMETKQPEVTAQFLARLKIGVDKEDHVHSKLQSEEQIKDFGEHLAEHVHSASIVNTAECMEDRRTIRYEDGKTGPKLLRSRLVYQLPGGLGLALTQAAVAADAAYLQGARNFQHAYELTYDLLVSLGEDDAGHLRCGADQNVENAAANPGPMHILRPSVNAVVSLNDSREAAFNEIQKTKKRKAEEGFYGSWSADWHADFLSQKVPQNFYYIATQNDAVHGHYGDGLLLIDKPGLAFAKNEFIDETGLSAFAVTMSKAYEISQRVGGPATERERLYVAFADNVVNVSDKIIAPDFPAYKIAA